MARPRKQYVPGIGILLEHRKAHRAARKVIDHHGYPVSGQKMPPESELVKPVLDRVTVELKESVAGERNIRDCRVLASKIKATGNSLKDPDENRRWFEALSKVTAGQETFTSRNAGKNAKPLRDPCCDAIKQALASLQTP
jgi:hypothetical protein